MSRKNKKQSDSTNQDHPGEPAKSLEQLFFESFTDGEKRQRSSVGSFEPITVGFELSEINRLFWLANSATFRQAAVCRLSEWEQRLLNKESNKDSDKELKSNLKKSLRKEQAQEKFRKSAQSNNDLNGANVEKSTAEIGIAVAKNPRGRWLDLIQAFGDGGRKQDPIEQAIVCLGAAYLLPQIVEIEGEESLQNMIDPLVAQAGQFRLNKSEGVAQLWLEQLLGVELPLVLARSFPDLVVDADWCEPAVDWMSSMIYENLDEQGWPQAALLPIFGPLMASWLRCWRMIEDTEWVFGESVVQQFHGAIRCLLRLVRSNGQLMFSDFNSAAISEECFQRMLQVLKKEGDKKFARQISEIHKADSQWSQSKKKKPDLAVAESKDRAAVKPSIISEWGSGAVFRNHWHSFGTKVGVCFSQREFLCEVDAAMPLVFGTAMPTVKFQTRDVVPIDEFDVVCEESDADVHYIELQMAMSEQVTLTRQILHLYPDNVLIIADCVVPQQRGSIEYGCEWPIAAGISVLPETETREVYLQKNRIESLVLPVSLPEWLIGPTTGNLRHNPISNRLQITDSVDGAGLYVPMIFDLCPKRSRKKRTWRRLTVAEGRKPVERDVAAAYRFQLDKEQWFFYRTVSSKGSRTFFGEHFTGEFVIAKFEKDGSVRELLRIE